MYLFINEARTELYTTNEHVDGLKPVHVTTVDRALRHYPLFTPMILLNQTHVYECADGRLTTTKPAQLADEAYYSTSITKHLTNAQVAHQSLKTLDFNKQVALTNELKKLWRTQIKTDGANEIVMLMAWDDSTMSIHLDHDAQTYTADLRAAGREIDGYRVKPIHASDPFVIAGWVYQ